MHDSPRMSAHSIPTLGGLQFWADRRVQGGWRLQQNVLTGRCRLLDDRNRRHAVGDLDGCRAAMDRMAPPQKASVVVLMLTGLARSRLVFRKLASCLEAEGHQVYRLSWPSTRCGYATHADHLVEVLDSLPAGTTVRFVTFSAGGPLLRIALGRPAPWQARLTLGPTVMIGPPNRGAWIAALLARWAPFRWYFGPLLSELDPARAAFPPLPPHTTIVAGGRGLRGWAGFNPLLPGDNDGMVCLSEACLPEAERTIVLPAWHSFLINHPTTITTVLAALRDPIPPSTPATTVATFALLRP